MDYMDRKLTDIFVVPPISVLDIKQKYWKNRKRFWLGKNIQSELGRDENLLNLSALMKRKQSSTSIFDPVLTEVMYKWFSKVDDLIYDPFAGGSVRGIVASECDRHYVGVDIRNAQIESNRQQAHTICTRQPTWICGNALTYVPDQYDFLFTCPPYYDLEQYSDDVNDLSNMDSKTFDTNMEQIITSAVDKLKTDRFAAIVVGDVRDEHGHYLKLPSKIITWFENAGCHLYNDMILLQEPATAAMRAFNFMNSSRKIAKAHQNVLVFVKGDWNNATDRLEMFSDKYSLNADLFAQ